MSNTRVLLTMLSWNRADVTTENLKALLTEADTLRPLYDVSVAVCDNGSTDGTQADLRAVTGVHCIFNETNQGNSIGRNQLIEHAVTIQADYILFVDCDITIVPGSVLEMLEWFKTNEALSIGANPYKFVTSATHASLTCGPITKVSLSYCLALTQYGLFAMSVLSQFRFDENMGSGWSCEDNDLALQVQDKTGLLNYTFDHCRYLHRQAHSSIDALEAQGVDVEKNIRDRYQYVITKWRHKGEFKTLIDWLQKSLRLSSVRPPRGN